MGKLQAGVAPPAQLSLRDSGPPSGLSPFPLTQGPEPLTSVQPTVLGNHLFVGGVPASLLGRVWWAKEGMGEQVGRGWLRRESE